MKTFQGLLTDHQDRTSAIIDKYISKYNELENPSIYSWNVFLLENAKDVITELTQSGTDICHEAISGNVKMDRDEFNSIRGVNLGAASRYQEELRNLYETIVRLDRTKEDCL